jgi:hypothetical protein
MTDSPTPSHAPDHDVSADGAAGQAWSRSGSWLSAEWRARSWWIKAPFLLVVATIIIGAKLGGYFAFEWLTHHLR